jgi:hypothetical protein
VLVVVAGCGRLGFDPSVGDGAAGGDSAPVPSGPHVELRLDRMAPGEPLADFPLPVVLDAAHVASGTPRFFADNGSELAAELETQGPPLRAWVRVPQIAGTTTTLTAVFGAGAPMRTDVWTGSYEGVWHLAEVAHDSSSYARTAMVIGTASAMTPTGPGRQFTAGNSDGIIIRGGASVALPQLTVSGWFSIHSLASGNSYIAMITRERLPDVDDDFYFGVHMGQPYLYVQTDGMSSSAGGQQVVLDQWTHYAATYDGAMARFYVDGAEQQAFAATGAILTDPTAFMIGCDRNTSTAAADTCDSDYLDATVDELRLESVARSAAWLAYEHAAMLDQVITYGPLVAAP